MKVLVIAENSFSKTENSGKTLCSFFSNFSPDNLAQLYFRENEVPYEELCNNYYRITVIDVLKSIFNRIPTTTNTHEKLIDSIKNNKPYKIPWYYRRLHRMRPVKELVWRSKTWDSPDLKKWIDTFKPDAIFTMLGLSLYVHKISISLSERYNIPLFIFFTDDYFINSTAKGIIRKIHYRLLRKQYKETISKAHMAYAIGEKMQQEYSKVFNKPFGILGNAIDFDKYSYLLPKKLEKGDTILLSYTGALHSNRWKTIVALGLLFKEINQKYDYNKVQIKVFSPTRMRKKMLAAFENAGIEFGGLLDSAGVIKQIENSHFLLHVESFDKASRTFVKYSVSTKISEYLSSSRMLLAYGPHEVASMQLLAKNNLGCCLTDLDTKEVMIKKICEAIENYNNYNYDSSKQFVLNNYTKEVMINRLESDLRKAINENKSK